MMLDQVMQRVSSAEQRHNFNQPVINIGSHPENDIRITGEGVSPFHAIVLVKEDGRQLVSLSPEAEIKLDGILLEASSTSLSNNQFLGIGDYTLRIEGNGYPAGVHVSVSSSSLGESQLPTRFRMEAGEEAILVETLSFEADVQVEQSAIFELEVINAGPIVASFFVGVEGIPEDWVKIRGDTFNLNEGARSPVTIQVTPPREPTSTAGLHEINIQISSPNYPDHDVFTPFELNVQPYYEFILGNISPKHQRIRWRKRSGTAKLPIKNRSNNTTDFIVSALDDENGCSFDFQVSEDLQLSRQATIAIPPGDDLTLPFDITPLKQALFALRGKRYHFTTSVQVAQQASSPQAISASATSLPLFGWWSILLGVIAIVFGLFMLLQPRIHSFQLASGKDVIELGDTTKLEWSVSPFATRLNISNVDQAINRGQKSLTVSPGQSTTYELVSGNWLSGMLGLDRKASQTVLVVPPTPRIGVFEVDGTTVDKGKPTNIRWSVTKADQLFLTVDEVIYELPPDQFSGEQEFILEKDAILTLEAINESGSELRSYFINVVPPHIDVLAFTVWVRSGATASSPVKTAKGGRGHLAQEIYIPDPNFPEKLVSLVPDDASDTGYRAEFFLADRELAKGEQVMLEWHIDGVETVQISPFAEALPNRGVQPFFPQESMNFVMTAVSGELEQIFMLPVKVFDGIPPEAPTVDFFQGAPTKMIGGGPVEFAWSVSGEWTRVQLASGESVIADYLNPQGFKTVNVSQSGTFILTAWNGDDLSTAAPFDVTVDPDLISVTLSITSVYPTTGRFMVGDKVTVSVEFGETPEDEPDPSGDIVISDGFATCSITLPALSCDLTFVTPGDPKSITASYSGDDIFLQATSAPYSGSISVSSANVNLVPTYFYLDKETKSPGDNIPNIAEQPLILDTGLFIKVKVAPVNTLIPDDDKGKVTVSICEQDGDEELIVEDSCAFFGAITVAVNDDGSGQADIVIQNFLSTGKKVLLFDYRHDENAITPASLTQYGIEIEKRSIYLSLPSCSDPVAFTGCEVGVSIPSETKVTFDIRNSSDDQLLSATLPEPSSELFDVFEVNSSGTKIEDWVCTVFLAVEEDVNVYKLDCIADFTGQTMVSVNFDFDNSASENYYMGDTPTGNYSRDPFDIKIKTQTNVYLDSQIMTGLKVGERARLTPSNPDGAIKLEDASGNPITNTIGDLELSSTATTAFGIETGSSCNLNAGTVTIGSINSNCTIYFGEQGDTPLDVSFLGDDNYLQSSNSLDGITIAKQDEINTTWQYYNSDAAAYVDWDITSWLSNNNLQTRIWLDGPAEFVDQALAGKILNISLDITKNSSTPPGTCSLTPNLGAEGTFPTVYQIQIDVSSGTPKADFTLNCDQEPMDITLVIELADQDNFEIQSGQAIEKSLVFANRPTVGMEAHFTRVADGIEMISFSPDQLQTLYMGEAYELEFVIGILWADAFNPPNKPGGPISIQQAINYYDNAPVNIDLPNSIASLIDWTNTTCQQGSGGTDVTVVMDSYTVINSYNYDPAGTGIHDIEIYNLHPCTLVFRSGSDVISPTDPIRFEFFIEDPSYENKEYDKTIVLQMDGLAKQTPSIVDEAVFDNVIGIVGDSADTDSMTLGRIVEGSSSLWPLNPSDTFASQFSIGAPAGCPNILDGTITNQTTASFTLTPPSVACQGTLAIEYLGNDWFSPITIATYFVDYSNATGTTTTVSSSDGTSEYMQSVTFTAAVNPQTGGGNPTGTVQFRDGNADLGNSVPLTNGSASLSTQNLSVGDHAITAVYTSDTNEFAGSQSNIFTQTVTAAATQTGLTTSESPSLLGESVTFTADVTASGPGGGTPTGSVQFMDGANTLGSAVNLVNGSANYSTSALTAGSHDITAVFSPANANYITSTSPSLTQQVNMETNTTLSSNSNNKKTDYGEFVTFTANVVVQNPGTGTPTGSIQFRDGNTNIGSAVTLSNGIATLSIETLIAGNHSITAVYIPTGDFAPSTSNSLAHTVEATSTTTTLISSQSTVTTTETLVFTATVTVDLPGGGTPTGSVQFRDGNSNLGSPITLGASGVVVYTGSLGSTGNHDITAMYISNSANFENSTSSKLTIIVN